jgi:hypothetical protein
MESLLADIEQTAGLLAASEIPEANRYATIREATTLLKRIRIMEGQIKDPKTWQVIHTRANELDVALEKFSN